MINDLVDNVYVLSLESDLVKYEILARKLLALGIDHERFLGVDGSAPEFDPSLYGSGYGSAHRSSGAVACLLSHINILEDAIEKKYKKILIFQDDIYFHKDFNELIEGYADKIKECSGFYLGASEYSPNAVKQLKLANFPSFKAGELITYTPTNSTNGLFGVILSEDAFKDSLKMMKCHFLPDDTAVHNVLCSWGSRFKDSSFVAYPNLVIPDTGRSQTWSLASKNNRRYRVLELHAPDRGWDLELYDLSERYYAKWDYLPRLNGISGLS